MAKRKNSPFQHIRRTYPGQGFYESNAAYRKRKKREREISSFLRKTGKAVNKLAKTQSKAKVETVKRYSHTNSEKLLREQEKVKLVEEAKIEYSTFQEWINILSNILLEREREAFDWDSISSSRGSYQKQEFQPSSPFDSPKEPTEASVRYDLETENSRIIFVVLILLISVGAFFIKTWMGILGIVSAATFLVVDRRRINKICDAQLPTTFKRAINKYQQDLQAKTLQYQLKIEKERKAHEDQEIERQKEWEEEESYRKRIRESVVNEDFEILEELIIDELNKLAFPMEQEIDLYFNDIHSVDFEFRLPSLSEVPTEDLNLTKTGKLSRKAMTQKKRQEIFVDLCAGVALRFAYELFRIVDFLDEVRIFGYTLSTNLAIGHDEKIYPLLIDIERLEFSGLNFDQIDASTTFNHLGGIFQCDRKGTLTHIVME